MLSPVYFSGSVVSESGVGLSGNLASSDMDTVRAVAPVINLSTGYIEKMVGEGIVAPPYQKK